MWRSTGFCGTGAVCKWGKGLEDVVVINTKERTTGEVESRTTFIHARPAGGAPIPGNVLHAKLMVLILLEC